MSVRLLKKVLNEQEQQLQHNEIDEESDVEEEEENLNQKPSRNFFDLLNEGDEDLHQDEEDEAEEESESVNEILKERIDKQQQQQQQTFPKSSKSKKKKKNKKSKEAFSSTSSIADRAEKTVDVDLELERLSLKGDSSTSSSVRNGKSGNDVEVRRGVKQYQPSVLVIDPKYLNVENELRRIFGSKVVKSFEKSNAATGSSSRQLRGVRRGNHHIRKTHLVTPSEHWPRWDGSVSMEFVKTKNGYRYFRYVHSSSYGQAQRLFEAAKAIHDLNGIASILMYNPYLLDSLITMAEYFKFVGEHQMSADAVGKCLYAMESAWHPDFTPFLGNCQLKFSEETNKPLFTALFAHMRNLDRRGCHRSALEVCKLLLSLDTEDPMGALFCIDYYALRAEEYAWLEKFSEDYKSDNSLWLFPNFSYSLAICRLYLEREEPTEDSHVDTAKATSTDLMKQALMLHPSVLKKLVAKVPLKDQVWTNILKNSIFRPDQSKIPSVDHLINIFVERSYLIWRLPDVQKLLRESALSVIESLEHTEDDAKDWACVRKEAFSSDRNEYSHLMVQDFSDSVPTLPPDNLQNFMVDPRVMREGVQIGDQNANPLEGARVPPQRDVANRNPLAVLFESMLPWVHYGEGDVGEIDEDNPADGHDQGNEE